MNMFQMTKEERLAQTETMSEGQYINKSFVGMIKIVKCKVDVSTQYQSKSLQLEIENIETGEISRFVNIMFEKNGEIQEKNLELVRHLTYLTQNKVFDGTNPKTFEGKTVMAAIKVVAKQGTGDWAGTPLLYIQKFFNSKGNTIVEINDKTKETLIKEYFEKLYENHEAILGKPKKKGKTTSQRIEEVGGKVEKGFKPQEEQASGGTAEEDDDEFPF